MKKSDLKVLANSLRKLGQDAMDIAALLDGATEAPAPAVAESPAPVEKEAPVPAKVWTLEEVRAILAEKARKGYRSEVKALLSKHGAAQLSDISDSEVLATLVAEAEGFGSE